MNPILMLRAHTTLDSQSIQGKTTVNTHLRSFIYYDKMQSEIQEFFIYVLLRLGSITNTLLREYSASRVLFYFLHRREVKVDCSHGTENTTGIVKRSIDTEN